MTNPKRLSVDRTVPGHWRVTLDNPPINVIDDSTYDELFDLVGEFDAEPMLKVVTFESANPDFFIAHYSSAEPRSRFGTPRWIETAERLAASSVLSVAVIRVSGATFPPIRKSSSSCNDCCRRRASSLRSAPCSGN